MRPGRASAELAERDGRGVSRDTDALGLGRPDAEPLASQTIPEIVALIERLIEHGAAYATADGDVYFSVEAYPHVRRALGAAAGRADRGLARRARRGQALAARLRALEGHKPDEDTAWDSPWGRGRPGLAHRVLGHGARAAGRGLRRARRRPRPDLPAPRERARAVGGRRRALRARRGCTTACCGSPARRCPSRSATSTGWREALERVGRETLLVFFAQAHYRSPVDYSDATLEQASATAAGLREALRNARRYAAAAGAGSDDAHPHAGRRGLRGLRRVHGRRSRHAARPGGAARPRARAQHGRGRRRGRSAAVGGAADLLVRALDVLGLASLDEQRRGRPTRRSPWPRSAPPRARRATTRAPTSCATRSRRSASACATRRRGRRSCPSMADRGDSPPRTDLVYGLQPVREALRGRRRVREIVCTREAAEAMPWIESSGVRMSHRRRRSRHRARRAPRPSGRGRARAIRIRMRTPRSCSRARRARRRARRRDRPPQPRRDRALLRVPRALTAS